VRIGAQWIYLARGRATLVLALILLAAYVVAVWAMSGKPD
jgi:hypothetical protein